MRKFLILFCFCTAILPLSAKTGIVLSGGGALGFAEAGALQALEEAGIKPDVVSGCSMGSIVGVFYAAGYSSAQMMEVFEKERITRFSSVHHYNPFLKTGFSKQTRLRKVLAKYIKQKDFDSLPIPYYACVADFKNGTVDYLHSGTILQDAVVASASIPIAYESIIINGKEYIDGGTINNFPIEPLLEQNCDKIIGINVISFTKHDHIVKRKDRSPYILGLTIDSQNRERYAKCDFYINIEGMNNEKYQALNFKLWRELIKMGYEQTKEYINKHPEILK
ncbi:MAG: patatin-like phospholipase family protein [Bacteroidales bacterium]|nr:patatin-like phospholipase family protein [Bacteroidales bacterium]